MLSRRITAALLALPLAAGLSFVIPSGSGVFSGRAAGPLFGGVKIARADVSCGFTTADLETITAARAQGLDADLAARKALLMRTIACAKGDAAALQSGLAAITVPGADASIRSQLSGKIDDAMTYYDLELAKVQTAGLSGTQQVAQEVLSWRQSNYDILAAQVANFELYESNQPLFATANDRVTQMQNLVGAIQQAGQNNDLQAAFSNAETLVQTANNENASARQSLSRLLPPDQSLGLIKESLSSLSDAYGKFFDVSTIVQGLLATKEK